VAYARVDVMREVLAEAGSAEHRFAASWSYAGSLYSRAVDAAAAVSPGEAEAVGAAADVLWGELVLRAVDAYVAELGAVVDGDADDAVAVAFAAGLAADVDCRPSFPAGYSEAEWGAFVCGFGEALRCYLASAEARLPWDLADLAEVAR
jgi:hypothetical protein